MGSSAPARGGWCWPVAATGKRLLVSPPAEKAGAAYHGWPPPPPVPGVAGPGHRRGRAAGRPVLDRGAVMPRPKLLDLMCGAGGCSVGYARAGFSVTGVDIEFHDDYPYELIVADAMDVLRDAAFLAQFDVIHASPPCPRYSTITPDHTRDEHPDLIPPVREALRSWGGAYVIENVAGAARHMLNPVKLCGSSFGLQVRRHRFFETNAALWSTPCRHFEQGRPIGIYGDHPQDDSEYRRPDGTRRGHKAHDLAHAQRALGIDWMTRWDDLADAIPPAMTEFVASQLLDHLAHDRAEIGGVS